jgi:hypothetical protein
VAPSCVAGHAVHFDDIGGAAISTGPLVSLKYLDKSFHGIAQGPGFHSKRRCLSFLHAAQETLHLERVLDGIMNHIVRDDPLLWAIHSLQRFSWTYDLHQVELAGAFGEDDFHRTTGRDAMLQTERLEPEVPDASSVPRQVLPLVQSIEMVDREVSYGFGLRQAQVHCNSAATFLVRLQ